jgi:pimeloyl-ACP methyl ester carboxylesterase
MRLSFYVALLGSLSPALAPAQAQSNARVFDSDGVQIRYVDKGSGDPVLLIHGFSGRLEFWETTGIAPGLTAAGFRVIAYDARGHGNSAKPHDPEQYGEEDVEDAVRLLDHLSIEGANVVGYSRGSNIASQLVARHPKRVRSVVFGGWGIDNPVETLSLEDCLATADSLARGAFPVPLARALQPSGAPPPTAEEQVLVTRQLAAGNDVRALAAAFRAGCEAHRVTAASLRATGVPALAIVGARDGMAPSVRVMARETVGAMEMIVIPRADHYTAPAHPEFIARVVSFLRDRRRQSPEPRRR